MKNILLLSLLLFNLYAFSQDDRSKMDWANLNKYSADNKTLMASSNKAGAVYMGNSITEGWEKFDSGFFASRPYINRGISGQTTPQMLLRFRPDVIDLKPMVVVILAGINDIAENTGPITLEHIFGNIVSMAELAKENNIKVVLCAVLPAHDFPWRAGIDPIQKIIDLNAMIKSYCDKNGLIYVDYYTAMVDENKALKKELTYDGVHPTLAGYKVMEPLVESGIQKALQR